MRRLWQLIFGTKAPESREDSNEPPITKTDLQPLFAEAERLRAPFIGLEPKTGEALSRADESCLGGYPWWPEGQPYPVGADGQPMVFLGQINFAEMPALEDFPDHGLLQFFVAVGCVVPTIDEANVRIAYWTETTRYSPSRFADRPDRKDSPFQNSELYNTGVPLKFHKGSMRPPSDDWRLETMTDGMWQRDPNYVLGELCEDLEQDRSHAHYVGGHPQYVQFDIRSADSYEAYETVLLQLGWDDLIMWGDAGEATFLIRRDDLLKRDFTKCLYNWDCS